MVSTAVMAVDVTDPECTPEADEAQYNWIDVTQEFLGACHGLSLGELVHDDLFGLYDAMSAIEMMDPKMDVGMACNTLTATHRPQTLAEAIECGAVRVSQLTHRQLVGLMDVAWTYLVSWLDGHSVLQTVGTWLPLQAPELLEDAPLRAFCTGCVHLVNVVTHLATSGPCLVNEEDFQPHRLPDAGCGSARRAIAMLRELENQLDKQARQMQRTCKTGGQSECVLPAGTSDTAAAATVSDASHWLTEALVARLRLLRCLLHALITCSNASSSGGSSGGGDVLEACEPAWPLLETAAGAVDVMQRSSTVGDTHEQVQRAAEGGHLCVMGFDPLLNQRQLPPSFPRYPRVRPLPEAFEQLAQLVQRLRSIRHVHKCCHLHQLLEFLRGFSTADSCVLSRCVLYSVSGRMHSLNLPAGMPSGGTWGTVRRAVTSQAVGGVATLVRAVQQFCAAASLSTAALSLMSERNEAILDAFFARCCTAFFNVLLVPAHNRVRQRHALKAVVSDLASLQDEADCVDAAMHQMCLTQLPARSHLSCLANWLLYHMLGAQRRYILSGFELQLYSVHEYHYVYWYLSQRIYGWLGSVLKRAEMLLMEHEAAGGESATHSAAAATSAASAMRNARAARKTRARKRKPKYDGELLLYQALQYLCGGLHKVCVGLDAQRRIRRPCVDFDNEAVRYDHRFTGVFRVCMSPPCVTYAQYQQLAGLHNVCASTAYMEACVLFRRTMQTLEPATVSSTDSQGATLARIAKMNFVVAKILHDGKMSSALPRFDFSLHKHFPLVRIQH